MHSRNDVSNADLQNEMKSKNLFNSRSPLLMSTLESGVGRYLAWGHVMSRMRGSGVESVVADELAC